MGAAGSFLGAPVAMLSLASGPWWEDDAWVCVGLVPLFILLALAVVEMRKRREREHWSPVLPSPSPAVSTYTHAQTQAQVHKYARTHACTHVMKVHVEVGNLCSFFDRFSVLKTEMLTEGLSAVSSVDIMWKS